MAHNVHANTISGDIHDEPNDHATEITVKIRSYPETGTMRAYVRVGKDRFRTHYHATLNTLLGEVDALVLTASENT